MKQCIRDEGCDIFFFSTSRCEISSKSEKHDVSSVFTWSNGYELTNNALHGGCQCEKSRLLVLSRNKWCTCPSTLQLWTLHPWGRGCNVEGTLRGVFPCLPLPHSQCPPAPCHLGGQWEASLRGLCLLIISCIPSSALGTFHRPPLFPIPFTCQK